MTHAGDAHTSRTVTHADGTKTLAFTDAPAEMCMRSSIIDITESEKNPYKIKIIDIEFDLAIHVAIVGSAASVGVACAVKVAILQLMIAISMHMLMLMLMH